MCAYAEMNKDCWDGQNGILRRLPSSTAAQIAGPRLDWASRRALRNRYLRDAHISCDRVLTRFVDLADDVDALVAGLEDRHRDDRIGDAFLETLRDLLANFEPRILVTRGGSENAERVPVDREDMPTL
jgi:predicted Zn-dependent protease with MMP-like domain